MPVTAFPSYADVNLVYALNKEWGDRFFPSIEYKRIMLIDSEVDDVHKEIPEEHKQFYASITIKGFVQPDPERYPLTKFGIEQVRNITMTISVPHLLESGLAEQDPETKIITLICQVGDRFTYSGILYDVLQIARGHVWANTDIPVDFTFRAERFRSEAIPFAGV